MRKILLFLVLSLFFLKASCIEDLLNKEGPKTKKIKIEYDYQGLQNSEDRWNRVSTEQTFLPAEVKIEVASTVEKLTPVTMYLTSQMSDCDYFQYLDNFISRTYTTDIYPIYLQSANTIEMNYQWTPIMGLSNNWRFSNEPPYNCSGIRNYSYTYFGNIVNYNPGKNYQSLLNRTIAHELMHQVANVWGLDAHCNHDFSGNENCNECTLWIYINEGYDFSNLGNTITEFKICPRHTTSLKNGPDLITDQPFTPVIPRISGNQNIAPCGPPCSQALNVFINYKQTETDLTISLAKKTYKLHEPILVMFEYVNNNSNIDTIRQNFKDLFAEETGFIIESNNGKIYKSKNNTPITWCYLNVPSYYVLPNDTFIASMRLNYRYGEDTKGKENYFDLYGYLEPGKYKVTAYTFIDGKKYIANIQEFEVVELNDDDRKVLELVKNKNIDEILKSYPENPFTEHVLIKYVGRLHGFYNDKILPSREETISDYKIFFDKYPNSFYNIDWRTFDVFLSRLAHSSQNFLEDIEVIKNVYSNTLLYRILNKEYFIKQFYDSFKKDKKSLQDWKRKYKMK